MSPYQFGCRFFAGRSPLRLFRSGTIPYRPAYCPHSGGVSCHRFHREIIGNYSFIVKVCSWVLQDLLCRKIGRENYYMTNILLLGAGFSRNWNGWLAGEVFEYLLGHPEILSSKKIHNVLWKYKNSGFENALYDLQVGQYVNQKEDLMKFENALIQMFSDMNQSFYDLPPFNQKLQNFFSQFDAIFSLNQDLLFEGHYHCGNSVSSSPYTKDGSTQIHINHGSKWIYWQMPGISHPKITDGSTPHKKQIFEDTWTPDYASNFKIKNGYQPYFKLHGSSNWRTEDGQRLLIMGGNKADTIKMYEVLDWYQEKFHEYLLSPDPKLMVIGYSFRDKHINRLIKEAVEKQNLKMFIIDPSGVDTIYNNNQIFYDGEDGKPDGPYLDNRVFGLNSSVIGASKRPLRDTFERDEIELKKITRFFE